MKLFTKHYLVYIIVLKWLESETIVICLNLHSKLRFWGFLIVIFSQKVVQTLFVLHETLHTTLFVIYYCLDIIRIKNIESYA